MTFEITQNSAAEVLNGHPLSVNERKFSLNPLHFLLRKSNLLFFLYAFFLARVGTENGLVLKTNLKS